jgi:hypothetical protein
MALSWASSGAPRASIAMSSNSCFPPVWSKGWWVLTTPIGEWSKRRRHGRDRRDPQARVEQDGALAVQRRPPTALAL